MQRRRSPRIVLSVALIAGALTASVRAGAVDPTNVGFDLRTAVATGGTPSSATVADVSGDGVLDLIVGNTGPAASDHRVAVLVQRNDGTFADAALYPVTVADGETPSMATAAGDIDGDGDADVAVATDQGIDVLWQDAGVLTGPTSFPSDGADPVDVQIADMNGDGRADVVSSEAVEADPSLHRIVLRSRTDLGLELPVTVATEPEAVSISVGDVDGDGQPDVVLEDGAASLNVLVQQDDLSYVLTSDPRVGGVTGSLFADVSGGPRDDLVLIRSETGAQDLVVMEASPDSPLADPVAYRTLGANDERSLEAADLNGDGTTDLVTLEESATTVWLRGEGPELSGPCLAPTVLSLPAARKGATAIGDLTGDGRPDLAAADGGSHAGLTAGFAPDDGYSTSLQATFGSTQLKVGDDLLIRGMLSHTYGCLEPGAYVRIRRGLPGGDLSPVGTALLTDGPDGVTFVFRETPVEAGTFSYDVFFPRTGVLSSATTAATSVTIERFPSTVGLRVSDRQLSPGDPTRLKAVLEGPRAGSISFFATRGDTSTLVGEVPVNEEGKAVLDVSPRRTTSYTASFAGSATYQAVGSEPKVVVVEAVVAGRMTRFDKKRDEVAIYECCRAWYRTWVKPKKPTQPVEVEVQYRQGGQWKTLLTDASTFSFGTDGTVVVSIDVAGGAGFLFRVRGSWAGDASNAGDSAPWVLFELR